jgi:hypothetical protein
MTITDKQVMVAALAYEAALKNMGGPLDCIRAALEAAEQAAWEPIETAPKDGTLFDLWVVPSQQSISGSGPERLSDCWFFNNSFRTYDDNYSDCYSEVYNATHWRPLPSPPIKEG